MDTQRLEAAQQHPHAAEGSGEMSQISIKTAGALGVITLRGGLFVAQKASLEYHLHTLLHCTSHVLMDCRELREMDASCMLLLCQTNRDCQKLMKRITAFGINTEMLTAATMLAKARYQRGCPAVCDGECLWSAAAD